MWAWLILLYISSHQKLNINLRKSVGILLQILNWWLQHYSAGEEEQSLERSQCQYVQIDTFFHTCSVFKKVKIFENILEKQKKT